MIHTRVKHSESNRSNIFCTFNNLPSFVWNLVEYKKTCFLHFHYLIYISHTSVALKYPFELTLTGDVIMNLQLCVRVVVPRATGFWCWRWVRGVGQRQSGASGHLRSIFQKLAKLNIWVHKCLFLTEKLISYNSRPVSYPCVAGVTSDRCIIRMQHVRVGLSYSNPKGYL